MTLAVPKWADFEDWAQLRRSNKDYLQPWEPTWRDEHISRHSYKSKLANFKRMVAADSAYPFHVFRGVDGHKAGQIVGGCNLNFVQRGSLQSAHIGYWIGEDYARNGFARAAVRASLRFAFNDLGLHRVSAAVQENNTASICLLESLGFTREGLARRYIKIDGHWQDHYIYAKLSTD